MHQLDQKKLLIERIVPYLTGATRAFMGSNERLLRVDASKDEGHSDTSSTKRVTSSSEDDCSVFSVKKGSLSAAAKSRI